MRRTLNGDELASEGWSTIRLRYNAFDKKWFDNNDIDPESVSKFLAAEIGGYELIKTGEGENFDYALEERVDFDGYWDNDR
jgi:hypothetical protein